MKNCEFAARAFRGTSIRFLCVAMLFAVGGVLFSLHSARSADNTVLATDELRLQIELVEALLEQSQGMMQEHKVGQRDLHYIILAYETYHLEVEVLRGMEARISGSTSNKNAKIPLAQLAAASEALEWFTKFQSTTEFRFEVGEVTPADVASVKAARLRAEIRVAAYKKKAGK